MGNPGGTRALPAPTTGPSARRTTTARGRPTGTRIGSLTDIPVGQGAGFTTLTGLPAVAVRLGQRRVVAYSAVCTHAGCTVAYDGNTRLLACPCHGAEFDPARNAAAVAGPDQHAAGPHSPGRGPRRRSVPAETLSGSSARGDSSPYRVGWPIATRRARWPELAVTVLRDQRAGPSTVPGEQGYRTLPGSAAEVQVEREGTTAASRSAAREVTSP
jgi:nitrite reductase/ring-hydroxylating ferredoxin subunit